VNASFYRQHKQDDLVCFLWPSSSSQTGASRQWRLPFFLEELDQFVALELREPFDLLLLGLDATRCPYLLNCRDPVLYLDLKIKEI
jgi:hypothetical protein